MFYEYHQALPLTGHAYSASVGFSRYVIIEAPDIKSAHRRAGLLMRRTQIALYPNCVDDEDGRGVPEVNGVKVAPYAPMPCGYHKRVHGAEGFIHYLHGPPRPFWEGTP